MDQNARPARRLHHIALGAVDVEAVARFYRDILELPELKRHHQDDGALRSIWLDLGRCLLMVERADGERAEDTTPSSSTLEPVTGWFLLALAVTPSERMALETRLESAGHPVEARTAYTSYARDPEGNRVAISHYPDDSTGSGF